MTASTQFKGVLAGLAAVAIAGAALAQSTPPNPAAKDPAVGAGQQSTQTTPMGSTGTPGGSSANSTTSGGSSSTTMGASGSTTTTTDTTQTDTPSATATPKSSKADRN